MLLKAWHISRSIWVVGCRRPSSTGWPGSVTSMASPSLLESSSCLSASSLLESAPTSRFFALFAADPASRLSSTGKRAYPPQQLGQRPLPPEIRDAPLLKLLGLGQRLKLRKGLGSKLFNLLHHGHLKVKRVSEVGHSPPENRGQL